MNEYVVEVKYFIPEEMATTVSADSEMDAENKALKEIRDLFPDLVNAQVIEVNRING